MKTVIIGGVAAGLSAASQIRRQDRNAQVVVLEKSGDVSYAACGMPYNLFYRDKPVEDLYALTLDDIRGGARHRLPAPPRSGCHRPDAPGGDGHRPGIESRVPGSLRFFGLRHRQPPGPPSTLGV